MCDIKSILANPSWKDIVRVPKIKKEDLHKLASHPESSVRFTAIDFLPFNDLALFSNDTDSDVQNKVERRLKKGF